jgi:hypothetical protein
MDVNRKREADWPHWPGRGSRPARRDRLQRRLFLDSEREDELQQALVAIRRLEEAAAAKAAEIDRLERVVDEQHEAAPALNGGPSPAPGGESAAASDTESAMAPASEPYLLFAWTPQGYALRVEHGQAPGVGARVNVEGREQAVAKLAPSPFPADPRRCAYLEPA